MRLGLPNLKRIMPKRRKFSGEQICKLLEENGFLFVRQRGSHRIMQMATQTARSQFLFQSTKISSQEHWLQSFGKANWIVLYFSDSSSLGAPKAGALPETHHNFGGRRSVGAFSPSAFFLSQSHGEHGGVSGFQIFRVSVSPLSPPPCLGASVRDFPSDQPHWHERLP